MIDPKDFAQELFEREFRGKRLMRPQTKKKRSWVRSRTKLRQQKRAARHSKRQCDRSQIRGITQGRQDFFVVARVDKSHWY